MVIVVEIKFVPICCLYQTSSVVLQSWKLELASNIPSSFMRKELKTTKVIAYKAGNVGVVTKSLKQTLRIPHLVES